MKLAVALGVDPSRTDTVADLAAVQEYGVKAEGSAAAARAQVGEELVSLVAQGALEVPLAATPLRGLALSGTGCRSPARSRACGGSSR